jgi:hypothetical protein
MDAMRAPLEADHRALSSGDDPDSDLSPQSEDVGKQCSTVSNVRSFSNVFVLDSAVPKHLDVAFTSHVRGRPALSLLLRQRYLGDGRTTGQLAQRAETEGFLSPEQRADAQGLRHYCGRKDYKCVRLANGAHRLVYITCRCQTAGDHR